MTTSGAANVIASKRELTQDFEAELKSKSAHDTKDVLKESQARLSGKRPNSEGNKQNTVDSDVNEISLKTKVLSNGLKHDAKTDELSQDFGHDFNHRSQQATFENFAVMEQTLSTTVSNTTSNITSSMGDTNIEHANQAAHSGEMSVVGDTPILNSQLSSELNTEFKIQSESQHSQPTSTIASQKRLQDLMQEFKSLLEDYQQQTLRLAKNFASITESKRLSGLKQNLDLSSIGTVVVQQQDLDGYESGLAQLTQTLNTMESELEASLRKAEYHELSRKDLEAAHLEMLERLASTSENRCGTVDTPDVETVTKGKHLDRVGKLCAQIAQTLGCADDFTNKIASSARLHDIGKLAIPDSILQKPDRLDPDEYATMKMHTIHGAEMLANNSSEIVQMAQRIALTHHENWDGTGYPYQLKQEEIALEGRIAAVADVYDALISTRIYKEAWPKEKAVEQIKSRSGTKFDPSVVEAFLKIVA